MTGKERIESALRGEQPDRTPVMLHNFLLAVKEAGFTMSEYREDPKCMAEAHIRAVETYQYDGVVVDLDTATLAGSVGVSIDYPENRPACSHLPLLENLDDIGTLPRKPLENSKYVQNWLEGTRLVKEHFGDEIYVRGNCDQCGFGLASMIRSPQEWMMDLLTDPDAAMGLLDYAADVSADFIRLMAQTGADMVSNGDSPAGPDMISPEMYRQFALPFEKRNADAAHAAGVPYLLHICGDATVILDGMVETGADALELDYKTDIHKIREACEGNVTFIGNIDPSGVLALGSMGKVIAKTEELLQVFAGNPRFILNAGCAIPAETPPENLHAMIQTARNFVHE